MSTPGYQFQINQVISLQNVEYPQRKFIIHQYKSYSQLSSVYQVKAINWGKYSNQSFALKIIKSLQTNEKQFFNSLIKWQQQNEKEKQQDQIIRIYELIEWQDQIIIIMELGQDNLQNYLQNRNQNQSFQFIDIGKLCQQIIIAINQLHRGLYIHGNITPESFIFVENQLKLYKFGICQKNTQLNLQGQTLNDLRYSPPEIIQGINNYSFAVDIWSLGCLIYEFVAKKQLIDDQVNPKQMILNHTRDQTVLNNRIFQLFLSFNWKETLKIMLNSNPQNRPNAQFILDLITKESFFITVQKQFSTTFTTKQLFNLNINVSNFNFNNNFKSQLFQQNNTAFTKIMSNCSESINKIQISDIEKLQKAINQLQDELSKLKSEQSLQSNTLDEFKNKQIEIPNKDQSQLSQTRLFSVQQFIGAGGEGNIYQVQELAKNKAIKINKDNKNFQKLKDTASILNQFQQQNDKDNYILNIYEVGQSYNIFPDKLITYQVMELGECDLKQYLQNNIQLTLDEKYNICIQLIKGVQQLHNLKLIHRDIKPENFIKVGSKFKLTDFDTITKMDDRVKTQFVGTQITMSPEMLNLATDYNEASDIWSLGCTLYYVFTQQDIFEVRSTNKLRVEQQKNHNEKALEKIRKLSISQFWIKILLSIFQLDQQMRCNINQIIDYIYQYGQNITPQ